MNTSIYRHSVKPLACTLYLVAVCSTLWSASGCGGMSDTDYQRDVARDMHAQIATHLGELVAAARDLQAAAPEHAWRAGSGSGSDPDPAIASMRAAWTRARVAYELVEGATAPLFPDQDFAMDARFDDFLVELGPDGDPQPFDGTGVTGMHAIERILFAPDIRGEVIAFEKSLPGYRAAAYPASDADAIAFKTGLVARLIADAEDLQVQWAPAAIDIGAAYVGLVGLMNEQREKVNLAATGEEESRYANVTLFDLRNNLAGTRAVYELFRAWVADKGGRDADAVIVARIDELAALYAMTPGDALPAVPASWSSVAPSAADLATPFGQLWQRVHDACDPARSESIVGEMNHVAELLGFPQFVAE